MAEASMGRRELPLLSGRRSGIRAALSPLPKQSLHGNQQQLGHSTASSNEKHLKGLLFNPKAIISPLQQQVHRIVDEASSRILGEYSREHGLSSSESLRHLMKKKWFRLLTDKHYYNHLLEVYENFLIFSDVLAVPPYFREVINNFQKNTGSSSSHLKGPYNHVSLTPAKVITEFNATPVGKVRLGPVWTEQQRQAKEDELKAQQALLAAELETETLLLQELNEHRKTLQSKRENLILLAERVRLMEIEANTTVLGPLLFPEAAEKNSLRAQEEMHQLFQEQMSQLQKNCCILDEYASVFLRFPTIDWSEEDPQKVFMSRLSRLTSNSGVDGLSPCVPTSFSQRESVPQASPTDMQESRRISRYNPEDEDEDVGFKTNGRASRSMLNGGSRCFSEASAHTVPSHRRTVVSSGDDAQLEQLASGDDGDSEQFLELEDEEDFSLIDDFCSN